MPANLISIATSCGPGLRRVMVVSVSGSVADVATYAVTVLIEQSLFSIVSLKKA